MSDLTPPSSGLGGSDPLSLAVSLRDIDMRATVANAVRRGDVMLAYQPIMQARHRDRVSFYEGLVRVRDENGRILPARDFMTSIEATELGREIDCLSLRLGFKALRDNPSLRLSINMSARSIGYPPWSSIIQKVLGNEPQLGERLILEITESSAMTVPEIVTGFMDRLQMRGVSFALDDFGAGFTSFRYLREFFFDFIKIDGQFIEGIHKNQDNQILTQALISVARHFEMYTVAEMVTQPQEAAFLQSVGIDCLQGYLFGPPTLTLPEQHGPVSQIA